MKTYVIMKQHQSPIAITEAIPHLVVGSLREARKEVQELNEKAQTNHYWYKAVKNTLGECK